MAIPRTVNITRRRFITNSTPNPFSFVDVSNAELSTNYLSAPVTISGLIGTAPITVMGGAYSINGGAETSAPGTVQNGDQVRASGTSAETNSTTTNVVVTIGGINDTFSITTVLLDIVPDSFDFTDITGAAFNTTYESNTITVLGINSSSPVTITTNGLSGPVGYSKNGAAYTTVPGTATLNDTFKVRLTTSNASLASFSTTLTIGGVSATYSVTNREDQLGMDFSVPSNSMYVAAIAA